MKTKRFVIIALVVCLFSILTNDALAFYNPQTGHWLSRDPSGEGGGANVYGFVDNNPQSGSDLLGLKIQGCIDKYLNSLGLKANTDYSKDDKSGVYTALRDVQSSDNGSFAKIVVIRMMLSSYLFDLAGKSPAENENNLRLQIGVRAKIIDFTRDFHPKWAEDGNGKPEMPNAGESWSSWFHRLNVVSTQLRCSGASKLILQGASDNQLGTRPNDGVYIPGDWIWLENKAWNNTWPTGFEGENLIVTVDGALNVNFWGFPYPKNNTFSG